MKIGIIGSGYVGLVAAAGFAKIGHQVFCCDSDAAKIKLLLEGKPPFFEPGLEELIKSQKSQLTFLHAEQLEKLVAESQVIFVAVGTPEKSDGSADLSYVEKAVESICRMANEEKIVAIKSTVPVGTGARIQAYVEDKCRHPIHIVSNPEFLRQGSALQDFLEPDRVIVGTSNQEARQIMVELYKNIALSSDKILVMSNSSAELTKYAANCFLALKISFINEIALLSDLLEADINDVRKGIASDHRISPHFLNPGIGFGGSCFPKDLRALLHLGLKLDLPLYTIEAADRANERQKVVLYQRLKSRFGSLKNRKIAVWGLSFKPQTDDIRRAPSIDVIKNLIEDGASVSVYDPIVQNFPKESSFGISYEHSASALDAAENAEALMILTEWPQFKTTDLHRLRDKMKTPVIFDGRNLFKDENLLSLGFEYYGIGQRGNTSPFV